MAKDNEFKDVVQCKSYKKLHRLLVNKRNNLVVMNKKLLAEGKREKYYSNCNVIMGMASIIDILPNPDS